MPGKKAFNSKLRARTQQGRARPIHQELLIAEEIAHTSRSDARDAHGEVTEFQSHGQNGRKRQKLSPHPPFACLNRLLPWARYLVALARSSSSPSFPISLSIPAARFFAKFRLYTPTFANAPGKRKRDKEIYNVPAGVSESLACTEPQTYRGPARAGRVSGS